MNEFVTTKVIGGAEVNKFLLDCQKEADAVIRNAARKEARRWMRKLRQALPESKWAKSIKVKAKVKKGVLQLSAGIYGEAPKGKEIPTYFKAYWYNYGTLKHRSPTHKFDYPVKPRQRRRRNNEGQRATGFFEAATKGADKAIAESIEKALKDKMEQMNRQQK